MEALQAVECIAIKVWDAQGNFISTTAVGFIVIYHCRSPYTRLICAEHRRPKTTGASQPL
jgi:hypothetical protein